MTFRVVFRHAAKSEFERAALWYEEQRSGLGEEFIREIDEALARAAATPQRHPVVFRDVRRAVARRFPFTSVCVWICWSSSQSFMGTEIRSSGNAGYNHPIHKPTLASVRLPARVIRARWVARTEPSRIAATMRGAA